MSIELKLFLISHHHRHQPLVISIPLDTGLSLEKRFKPTVPRWTDRLAKRLLVPNFLVLVSLQYCCHVRFASLVNSHNTHEMNKGGDTPYCLYVTTRVDVLISKITSEVQFGQLCENYSRIFS